MMFSNNNNNNNNNYYYKLLLLYYIIESNPTDQNVATTKTSTTTTTTTTAAIKIITCLVDRADCGAVAETFRIWTRTDQRSPIGWFGFVNNDDVDDKAGAREWRVIRSVLGVRACRATSERKNRGGEDTLTEKRFENPSASSSTRKLAAAACLPLRPPAADKRGPFRDDARRHFRTGPRRPPTAGHRPEHKRL